MKTLRINVVNKVATYQKRDGAIVCGNSDYQVRFTFDEEWAGHEEKTAHFVWKGHFEDVDFTGDTCPVPKIYGANTVKVGVYAGDQRTTTSAIIPAVLSCRCGGETPSVENDGRFANEAKEAADRAEEAAERAEVAADRAEAEERFEENYVTPQMFGAKGDGVADDTKAIQAAINSGKAVQFAHGCTHLITSTLVINRKDILIIGNNATVKLEGGRVCNVLEFTPWTGNATIERLTLMGNDSNLNGVYLDGTVTSLRFYQVTVSNNGQNGVKVANYSWGNQFVECNFTSNGDCGFHASGVYTEGKTIGCLSTTDFNMCRFTRNTNAGIILNGSTNKFYGGWFEGNDIGLVLSAEAYYCGNVDLIGVDIEGNISHAIKFIGVDVTGTLPKRGVEYVRVYGGQVCGSTTNKSLFYYEAPTYSAFSVDIDSNALPLAGLVSDANNTPIYIHSNKYPMTGFAEGYKIHVYINVNRISVSDSKDAYKHVIGFKPTGETYTNHHKYKLSPGECVMINFEEATYCTNVKFDCSGTIKPIVRVDINNEFISHLFPTPTVVGESNTVTVFNDVKNIWLRNDGNEETVISDILWSGKLPNN